MITTMIENGEVKRNSQVSRSRQEQKSNESINDPKVAVENSKGRTFKPRPNENKNSKLTGPIKILVIKLQIEYYKTVWHAIAIGFAHIIVGVINVTVFVYYVYSTDVHALLCCIAYHFFSAEAILGFNHVNGWSTPMRQRHRRFVHVFLQLCGMACAIVGTTEVILRKGMSGSFHGVTGVITAVLAVLSVLSGPCGLLGKNHFKIIHISCGMPTFLMSSISLCTGLFTAPFKGWADPLIIYVLTGFVIFYSVFIIATCFIKCMIRI